MVVNNPIDQLPMISATEPEWSREHRHAGEWSPSKRLIASIRDYQRLGRGGIWNKLRRAQVVLRHRFWSVVTGADVPLNCQLGGGLVMPHPTGIVIHPGAQVGPNCIIFQQVTLGTLASGGFPVIGGHVDIGAGAKLLGPIRVGDHAVVGANAVVLVDVPDHHIAVGVPARCLPRKEGEAP